MLLRMSINGNIFDRSLLAGLGPLQSGRAASGTLPAHVETPGLTCAEYLKQIVVPAIYHHQTNKSNL
ncbi:MAG: hypothetical protein V4447_10305 [Pseudomonadota bacterium]